MGTRTRTRIALLFSLALVHVLAPPATAYRTLGMVSGQGENESSAMHMAVEQARRIDADAVVIEGRRNVGSACIVTARAIKYTEAPPP
jgi:hypothetical protein